MTASRVEQLAIVSEFLDCCIEGAEQGAAATAPAPNTEEALIAEAILEFLRRTRDGWNQAKEPA
jgi:hypothetical protein